MSVADTLGSSGVRHGIFHRGITKRGAVAYALGVVLTGFYILLYWFPQTLECAIRPADGLSLWLRGREADQWFLYGLLYTVAVLAMGIRFIRKYKHSRYQVIRTGSVMFFQLGFAFLLPAILLRLNQPEFYFTYFWPLKREYLFPDTLASLQACGALGTFMVCWGVLMIVVVTPVLTYFYGKRWYCSWVCGCGGLAETAGDPFRHLSDKRRIAWRTERWLVYPILGLIVVLTLLLWINSCVKGEWLGTFSGTYAKWYGFLFGSLFSGVIGTGFYPILGSRVWCRFGCPMAAILGIQQKYFSRFRITTNGGQCISCGNCSVHCEMGIDVRQYAQKGQDISRASCVGCGMCAEVCPRGVLKLENR
jgi:polyferredoxin